MKKLEYLVRNNIRNLKAYSCARDEFEGTEAVFLDANENPFGELNRYPDPYQSELKNEIGRVKNVDLKNIFIGNGSDEAIDLIFRIFCEPGKEKALTFSPTYGMYQVSADINNVDLINLPLDLNFQIDLDSLTQTILNPLIKVIFICSPNNPTANLINSKLIETIIQAFDGIVVIDEAYIDYSSSESWIRKIDQYNNLIVLQTLSKAWGMANLRVGMAFSNPQIINWFNKVKPPYNVSGFNQKQALKQLKKSDEFNEKVRIVLREKNRVKKELQQRSIVVKIYPSDTNFLLVEVVNAKGVYDELIQKGIVVRNRSSLVENTIRITIGTPEENDQLLTEIKALSDEKSIVYR